MNQGRINSFGKKKKIFGLVSARFLSPRLPQAICGALAQLGHLLLACFKVSWAATRDVCYDTRVDEDNSVVHCSAPGRV